MLENNKPVNEVELSLIIWPDPILKIPVDPFPEDKLRTRPVKNTAGAMIKMMYEYHGVGLAAQQVGVPFQIFVMDTQWFAPDSKKKPQVFINPKIVDVGSGAQQLKSPGEGCLSFPYEYKNPVKRLDKLELEWLDFKGEVHHKWFSGFEAIVVQHEMDHLMGYCFIDRLSPLKRDMAIRKAKKIRRFYKKGYRRTINKLKHAHQTPAYNFKRQRAYEEGVRAARESQYENNDNS